MIDPADPHQLDRLLRRHRITLKHRLGQNFLTDHQVRDAIADAANVYPDDVVVEVGAGVGTLTVALAPRCQEVIAIEVDPSLLPALHEAVSSHVNVTVVQSDVLRYDFAARFPAGGEVVAGNIPYNLTGSLIRKLLDAPARPRRLSFVVQKEVAERWTAVGGASLATVAVQVFAEPRKVLSIPASAFIPPPKVDSALVVLEVRDRPAVEVADLGKFFDLVEFVFQFRRKQLGGTLARYSGIDALEAKRRLAALGIEPSRRPQTLALGEWEAVDRSFAAGGG